MDENMNMEQTTMATNPEESSEETGGAPIGLLFAGVVAGGVVIWKGLSWIGGKILGRKKYAEVERPVRLVKDKNK